MSPREILTKPAAWGRNVWRKRNYRSGTRHQGANTGKIEEKETTAVESLLAHDAGEVAPLTCRYCIVAEDSPKAVGIEPGPIFALDADSAEDLHIEAAQSGNGVGWLLFPKFNCSALGLIRFAFLNSLSVAFPVRTLTRSIVPQYLAASDPATVQSMLPLGLEQMTYSFLDLMSNMPCEFWF